MKKENFFKRHRIAISVIVLIAGYILFSWLMIKLVNSLDIEWISLVMTWNVAVLATTLTFIIGIISGIGPAKKDTKLQPINALRFE